MDMSFFDARSLSAGIQKMGDGRTNFLRNQFFRQGQIHMTDTIDFGVLEVLARVLRYSRSGEAAGPIDKIDSEMRTVEAPKIRKKKVFDEKFAKSLNAALSSYMGTHNTDLNAQLAQKVALEQMELRRRADRTIEVQCAQALSKGQITITYEDGSSVTISMGFITTAGKKKTIQPVLSGSKKWSSSGSDPIETLDILADQIRDHSDYDGPLDAVLGFNAWTHFRKNKRVMEELDNRRVSNEGLAPISDRLLKGNIGGYNIWQYTNGYVDGSGNRQQAWDPNIVALVPAESNVLTVEYASPYDYPTQESDMAEFIPTTYFSKIVKHKDPPVSELIVESRPLALIKDPAAIRIQDVIT